jgi:asparagine synthetase B (glutamine-hydrolysing)
MLSSGKDSSAVALALAEAGHAGFPCVTFRDDESDEESRHARDLCQRLGLRHEVVDLAMPPGRIEAVLVDFWSRSALPCGDFAQIPYALCVAQTGAEGGAVLDGSGNDAYMGYVPAWGERLKWRFALGAGALSRFLAGRLPPDSGWNYFLRSRAASTLPGRTFRPGDTRSFYPESVDTGADWQRIGDAWSERDVIGFRNTPVEHHVDQAEITLKIHLAAEFRDRAVVLPFCDEELIGYSFNLPESNRFDRRRFTNKLLLREMLERYAAYDPDAVGKQFFPFAGDRFLLRHRAFALHEIRRCRLWDARVGPRAEAWFRRLERRPLLYHCLLPLFMLSGWYNHSRYIGE